MQNQLCFCIVVLALQMHCARRSGNFKESLTINCWILNCKYFSVALAYKLITFQIIFQTLEFGIFIRLLRTRMVKCLFCHHLTLIRILPTISKLEPTNFSSLPRPYVGKIGLWWWQIRSMLGTFLFAPDTKFAVNTSKKFSDAYFEFCS